MHFKSQKLNIKPKKIVFFYNNYILTNKLKQFK